MKDEESPTETSLLTAFNANGLAQNQSKGLSALEADALSDASDGNELLLEEMESPWPATFERSISLLSSPVMTPRQVDLVTKSPKPGNTPIFGRIEQRRGIDTPDHSKRRILRPITSFDDSSVPDKNSKKAVDFRSTLNHDLVVTAQTQQQKAAEAHAYRQRLLDEQRKKESSNILKKKTEKSSDKASFSQCVFNMSNILMGVGMLGLPFVFKCAGWLGGSLVTLTFGFITWRTSILIGRQLNGDNRPVSCFDDSPFKSPILPGSGPGARMRPPMTSFPQIAREAFGEKGNFLLSSILYFELFSCLCIFLVTMGDHLSILFPKMSKQILMVLSAVALSLPTAILRTPKLLSYLSMVGTFATASVVLSVLFSALIEGDISQQAAEKEARPIGEPLHILWATSGLPTALGLIAYTFSGHAIVPSIYTSMERPKDFERMINVSFLIVVSACCVVAVSGYYMFGSAVEDQVTLSLQQNSSAPFTMKCLTWLMILTAFSKFTLTMFPLALGIEELVAPYIPNEIIMSATDSIIKFTLISLALVIALFVPSFSFICSLVGLICTMAVSVIFPAGAHLVLFRSKLGFWERFVNWIFVLVGFTVAVIGTLATV